MKLFVSVFLPYADFITSLHTKKHITRPFDNDLDKMSRINHNRLLNVLSYKIVGHQCTIVIILVSRFGHRSLPLDLESTHVWKLAGRCASVSIETLIITH